MPRPSQSAKAPASASSASTPTKASSKKRTRDDTDADVETTTPKRQRVKKASTTEPESASNADAPSTPASTRKTRTPAKRPAKKAPIVMPTLTPIPEESVTSAGPSDAASSTPAPAPKKRGKKTVAFESPVVTVSAAPNDTPAPPPATPKTRTPKKSTTTPRKSTPRASTPLTRSATKAANSSTDMAVAGDEAATPVQKKTATQSKKSKGKAAGTPADAPKASTPAPKKPATSKKTAATKTATPKRATKRALTTEPEESMSTPKQKRLRTKSPVAESPASVGESSASAAAAEPSNTSTDLPVPSAIPSSRDPVEVSDLAELLQQGPSTRRKNSRKPAPKPRRRLVSKKELNAAAAARSDSEEQADTSSVIYKNAGEKRIHEETFRRVHEDSTPRPVKRVKTKPSSTIDLVPQQSARSINSITSRTTDAISIADEELSDSGIDVASQSSASNDPSTDAACYPSTCLYSNHALNPLQARVPKSARLHLRHFSAADASSAYGIVPVSLRRLLRCSIRVQTLYARHGLAGMDDAELPLPPWVTRETAFSYETYVATKHNHIWVSNNWWTSQRLLDLYALALYMQDPDCCDAAASALVRLARGADVEEHVLELDVVVFLQQLDWLADLVADDDRDDEDYGDYDDDEKLHLRTVALANSAPIRALLLDILSAPPHAAATFKALSSADVLYPDDIDPFFAELQTACRTRITAGRGRRSVMPSPMFMAQERKWCERYHFHAHWFPLDDAELLFPPSSSEGEGEEEDDPSRADRGCHALRALRLVEEEQMPGARGEREVWEEEKRMYEEWQGCGIEGYEMETFECSRVRLGDRGKWRVGGDDGMEIVMREDY